jgi:hypothetical protein
MTETAAQVKFVLDSWIPFAITLVFSDVCRGELQPRRGWEQPRSRALPGAAEEIWVGRGWSRLQ